jgi:hypothetical protein
MSLVDREDTTEVTGVIGALRPRLPRDIDSATEAMRTALERAPLELPECVGIEIASEHEVV